MCSLLSKKSGAVPFSIGRHLVPVENPETAAMPNMAVIRQIFRLNKSASYLQNYKSLRALYSSEETILVSCGHELALLAIGGWVYEPLSRPSAMTLYTASEGWKPSHDPYFCGSSHNLYSPYPQLTVVDTP
jgi:hypothetical protein